MASVMDSQALLEALRAQQTRSDELWARVKEAFDGTSDKTRREELRRANDAINEANVAWTESRNTRRKPGELANAIAYYQEAERLLGVAEGLVDMKAVEPAPVPAPSSPPRRPATPQRAADDTAELKAVVVVPASDTTPPRRVPVHSDSNAPLTPEDQQTLASVRGLLSNPESAETLRFIVKALADPKSHRALLAVLKTGGWLDGKRRPAADSPARSDESRPRRGPSHKPKS